MWSERIRLPLSRIGISYVHRNVREIKKVKKNARWVRSTLTCSRIRFGLYYHYVIIRTSNCVVVA